MSKRRFQHIIGFFLILLFISTSGCSVKNQATKDFMEGGANAQTGATQPAPQAAPLDQAVVDNAPDDDEYDAPLETIPDPLYGWNHFWYRFNDLFYMGLMRPFAIGYKTVMPEPVRTGLKNAYDNFIFPIRFVNCLLQLKPAGAAREFGRFMINSTFGLGGFFDLAKSDPNLQPGDEDFGQTLAYYGMGDGFYIVWPFIGPSSLRDSFGLVGDAAANPLTYIFGLWGMYGEDNPWYWSYVIRGADIFNRLPDKIDNLETLKKSAIDPYASLRDAYIQYRRNAIKN